MTGVNLLALYTNPNFNKKESIQGVCIALIFLILLYSSPAALLIYWTVNNLISLCKNIFFLKFNPKKGTAPFIMSILKLDRAKPLIPVTLLISLNTFLFGPFTMYANNVDEFTFSLVSVFGFLALMAFAISITFFALGLILPEKFYSRYISIVFAVGFLSFLQGNILIWKYGLLDGQGIDWSQGAWRGWVDGAIWLVLLLIAIVASRRIQKIAFATSLALVLIQLVSLIIISVNRPEIWKDKIELDASVLDSVYDFSKNLNVIHFILDGVQSDMFQDLINERPQYYGNALNGFTFFREATGVFPTTRLSLPAFLSGNAYGNNLPINKFIENTFKGENIINALQKRGFKVDIVNYPLTDSAILRELGHNYYHVPLLPSRHATEINEFYGVAILLDLVLLRQTPYFIKRFVYNDQRWLVQRAFFNPYLMRYIAEEEFIQELVKNLTVMREESSYKYIHLAQSHVPVVVDRNCQYTERILKATRENLLNQYRCSMELFIGFLDKLKNDGIYDSSLIVLNADHGAAMSVDIDNIKGDTPLSLTKQTPGTIVGSAMTLLAIKPPGSSEPLQVSDAQVSIMDIPETISSVLGYNDEFNGRSAFDVAPDEVRQRQFYYYKWLHTNWQADYFSHLDAYIIKGSVYDAASWQRGPTFHKPGISYQTSKIDFGTTEGFRFLRMGWTYNMKNDGKTVNWALGDSASIYLTLPKDTPVTLTANIRPAPMNNPQIINIIIDGRTVGQWELNAPWILQEQSVVIEPDKLRPDVSIIEFVFSESYEQVGNEMTGEMPVTVMFESILLKEKSQI